MGLIQAETERCLAVNAAYLNTFGLRREEVIGRTTLWVSLWPDPHERQRLTKRALSVQSLRNLKVSLELPERGRRQLLVTIDRIPLGREEGLLTTCHDVTEWIPSVDRLRRRVSTLKKEIALRQVALQQSQERLRTFCDYAPNMVFLKDMDGRYLYVNRRFRLAFHMEEHDILGKTDEQLFPLEQARQMQIHDRLVAESGRSMKFEESVTCADGLRTSVVVKFPLRDKRGAIYAMGGIATDITGRRRIKEELQHQRAQLEDVTARLLTAQDQERQRIARDLHDDVGQRMTALLLDLAVFERQPPVEPQHWIQLLASVREQLEQLSDDLHNLAHHLHPTLLVHAGLQAAMEDLVHRVASRTGLHIRIQTSRVPPKLSLEQGLCLFRVLQESLQNVVRHAQATEVTVCLVNSTKGVGLSVKDNGQGFYPSENLARRTGLGLISMRERLRLMGGWLNLHSKPGEGTKICAWIPFHEGAL
jgi:PAS domain S-box-containing protein